MKMMRSTSTTSTRGVTLMSDFTVPLPPTCMGLWFSRRFSGLRHQAYVVEAHIAERLQDVYDLAVLDELVALDGDLAIRRTALKVLQRLLHFFLANDVRSYVDRTVGLDGDQELLLRVRRLLGILGHRQVHRHA